MEQMWEAHKQRVCAYYEALLDQHGPTVAVADASSQEHQEIRYRVITEMADFRGKSVLDVGCGLGWFGDYLTKRYPTAQYFGVDLSQRVIDQARVLRPYAFGVMDILKNEKPAELFDIVVGNGIIYLLHHAKLVFDLIKRMIELSREVTIFNSLNTSHIGNRCELLIDPEEIIEWNLHEGLRMAIRDDYLPHDFTVGIYK